MCWRVAALWAVAISEYWFDTRRSVAPRGVDAALHAGFGVQRSEFGNWYGCAVIQLVGCADNGRLRAWTHGPRASCTAETADTLASGGESTDSIRVNVVAGM